jgi:hypothetical protein
VLSSVQCKLSKVANPLSRLHELLPFGFFLVPHLAWAAFLAISFRSALVSFLALAAPPTVPPIRPISDLSSAVSDRALSFARATAAGFLRLAIVPSIAP